MDFQPVKGTRDFYPQEMALRNWLAEAWRRVSLRNGFVEFDGPVMEHLDLFRAKSGEEIVSELFSFTDRGGRELALRPEITPTLARMVNARINSLPRPIKWFSIPRLFRAENPQRGRLREFFQWNVDVIGSDDVFPDAECIFTCIDLLAELGLRPEDAIIRIGSRPLTTAMLRKVGVGDDNMEAALAALDKRGRVTPEQFGKSMSELGLSGEATGELCRLQDAKDPSDLLQEGLDGAAGAVGDLLRLRELLETMEAWRFCRFDFSVVRGLAYYTGIVYEVHDAAGRLRAVAGGGRYDNLLEVLGGPAVGATGFGMGDAVLAILLEQAGKLPDLAERLDCFVVTDTDDLLPSVLRLVGGLRRRGVRTDFAARARSLSKLLKEANRRNARYAAIVMDTGRIGLKDLAVGEQADVALDDLLADPAKYFGR